MKRIPQKYFRFLDIDKYRKEILSVIKALETVPSGIAHRILAIANIHLQSELERKIRWNAPPELCTRFCGFRGSYILKCFDHGFTLRKEDGIKLFGFEPYTLESKDVEELIIFCKERNFWFRIHGMSSHFPNNTIQVIMGRKNEVAQK